jgi:2-polyprenyl-6-methoxyphenol hydroxylase-like FAD-dependent oxidoreductase
MPNSQKICIIGSGLTALTIAYLLSKFRLQIDIVGQDLNKKKIRPTKLALSKNSLDQLCLYGLKDIKKKSNVVKNIYLHDSYSSISLKQDLHFSASNKKEALAYIIDGNTLSSEINKKLKSLKILNLSTKKYRQLEIINFSKKLLLKI